jgi:hypothetical protein
VFTKVYKCPGVYNKLACEVNSYDSAYEYSTYLAYYTNKVVLRTKNRNTYTVEGRLPHYSINLGLDDFICKLGVFFDEAIRFEIRYISKTTTKGHISNVILLERNCRTAEAYILNIQLLNQKER